jgi:hypothetical protein
MTSATLHGVEGRETSDRVARHPAVRASARIGLAARGVLYVIVGVLALRLAFGERQDRADKSGALAAVARQPFGEFLLGALAVGFAAYAVWMAVRVFTVDGDNAAKTWGKRAGYVARTFVYGALCFSAIDAIQRSNRAVENSSSRQEKEYTATVLGWPFGRALVIAAGVAIIGAGLVYAYRAFTQKWREHFDLAGVSPRGRTIVIAMGWAGWLGRGVVFTLVGFFVVRAAVQFDPKEAVGLDGALRELTQASFGRWVLLLAAIGLFAFGCYSLIEAKFRRVEDD